MGRSHCDAGSIGKGASSRYLPRRRPIPSLRATAADLAGWSAVGTAARKGEALMTIYAIIVALALLEAAAIALVAFPPRFRLNRRLPELPEGSSRR
jgi:hypothetical protein